MSKGYICIFAKPDKPNVSRVEYSRNWRVKLSEINSGLYGNLYYCYAIYETRNADSAGILLSDIVSNLNSQAYVSSEPNMVSLSPEKVYLLLKSIAYVSETEKKLTLYPGGFKPQVLEPAPKIKPEKVPDDSGKMGKDAVIDLVRKYANENGIKLSKKITYASKIKNYNYYWANTVQSTFYDEWNIVLEDYDNKIIHLFYIPRMYFKPSQFRIRKDSSKEGVVSLTVRYNDDSFKVIDARDKTISLGVFLVASFDYDLNTITKKASLAAEDSNMPFRTYRLYDADPDVIKAKPCQITFNGIDYTVNTYQDMVEKTLELCLEINKDKIYDLAERNSSFLPGGRKAFLTTDPSLLPRPEKVKGYNIYFDTIMNASEAIKFVQWLGNAVGIDSKNYSYTIYKKISK